MIKLSEPSATGACQATDHPSCHRPSSRPRASLALPVAGLSAWESDRLGPLSGSQIRRVCHPRLRPGTGSPACSDDCHQFASSPVFVQCHRAKSGQQAGRRSSRCSVSPVGSVRLRRLDHSFHGGQKRVPRLPINGLMRNASKLRHVVFDPRKPQLAR